MYHFCRKQGCFLRAKAALIAALILGSLTSCAQNGRSTERPASLNEGLASSTSFSVEGAEGIETSAKGAVFVFSDKDKLSFQLVADLTVDASDWGGVSIHIPAELRLDKIISDFRSDAPGQETAAADDLIAVWTTESSTSQFSTFVEVARVRGIDPVPVGGHGFLILELSPTEALDPSEMDALEFAIGIGAGKQNGVLTVDLKTKRVSVALP